MRFKSAASFAALSLLASASTASLVAYDGFEEAETGKIAGQDTGTGFTDEWAGIDAATIFGQSLCYSNEYVFVDGGEKTIRLASDANQAFYRSFPATSSNTLYMSFLINAPTLNSGGNFFFSMGFAKSWSSPPEMMYNGFLASPYNSACRMGMRLGGSTPSYDMNTDDAFVANRTYFVVFKMAKSTGGASAQYNTFSLFVNPSTTNEPAASISTTANVAASSFQYFNCRVARRSSDIYLIDELRIGTTWEDVVPVISHALPDPAPAPVFSPASRTTFTNSMEVAITSGIQGAEIRYTMDGSAPDADSLLYEGPVTITQPTYFRAFVASAEGYIPSEASESMYGRVGHNPIATEDFSDYAPGDPVANRSGGDGFMLPWANIGGTTIVEKRLVYSNGGLYLGGSRRAARINGASNAPIMARRIFPVSDTPLYLGFLVCQSVNNTSGDAGNDDFLQIGFSASQNSNPLTGFLQRYMRLGMRHSSGNTDWIPNTAPTTVEGQVNFVVLKVWKTSGTVYNSAAVFINPDSIVEPASPTASITGNLNTGSLEYLNIRSYGLEGADRIDISEIRIGTTFESVFPPRIACGTQLLVF